VFQIRAGRNRQINQRSRLARFCSSRARRGPQAAAIAIRPAKGTKTGSRQFVYKACMADHGQVERQRLNCKGLARTTQAASAPASWPINTKLVEPTVAKVKTAILQHALSIALVGIHALGGAPGLPAATMPAGEPSTRSVQYCVPQDDDPNFYRFYCRRDAAKPYRSEAEEHAKNSNCSSVRVHYVKTESRPRWDSDKQTSSRQHDPRD